MKQHRSTPNQLPNIAGTGNGMPTGKLHIRTPEPLSFDFAFELEVQPMPSPKHKHQRAKGGQRAPSSTNVKEVPSSSPQLDQAPVLFRPSLQLIPE